MDSLHSEKKNNGGETTVTQGGEVNDIQGGEVNSVKANSVKANSTISDDPLNFIYKCIYCNEKIFSEIDIPHEFGLKCGECINIESYFKMLEKMPLIDINADDEDISPEVNNMIDNNRVSIIISYQKKNSTRLLHRICVSTESLDIEKFNKFGYIPKNSNIYIIIKKLYNFKKLTISRIFSLVNEIGNYEDDDSSDT